MERLLTLHTPRLGILIPNSTSRTPRRGSWLTVTPRNQDQVLGVLRISYKRALSVELRLPYHHARTVLVYEPVVFRVPGELFDYELNLPWLTVIEHLVAFADFVL
jgi:hypothetical protein